MHEHGCAESLVKTIVAIAQREKASQIVKVSVQIGALSHISPSHFQEHFTIAAQGTMAEGACVEAEIASDTDDSQATGIFLKSIDVV